MNKRKPRAGLCAGFLFPHPPIIVPPVGKGKEFEAEATINACRESARQIARLDPETLVILSPHAPLFRDYVYIYDRPRLSGSFAKFGAPEACLEFSQDTELRSAIVSLLEKEGIDSGSLANVPAGDEGGPELDHGALVPLYFIREECPSVRIVVMASAAFGVKDLQRIGAVLGRAAIQTGRRVCILASGDMSHRVNKESPYGAVPEGAVFDAAVTRALAASDIQSLLSIDPSLREKAGECGYGSIVILCGAFGHQPLTSALIGYEAPFGIGYCVASFTPGQSDLRVRIARFALESYVRSGKGVRLSDLSELCVESNDAPVLESLETGRSGVFVSLKKYGDLRGCIGTTSPTTACVAEEIIQNAISAAIHDPRFESVTADELALLEMSVDVLGAAVPVLARGELDPAVWGVIVSHNGRRGLLLPDLEGVDTVESQLAIACRKAGIDPRQPYTIEKFTVTRYY